MGEGYSHEYGVVCTHQKVTLLSLNIVWGRDDTLSYIKFDSTSIHWSQNYVKSDLTLKCPCVPFWDIVHSELLKPQTMSCCVWLFTGIYRMWEASLMESMLNLKLPKNLEWYWYSRNSDSLRKLNCCIEFFFEKLKIKKIHNKVSKWHIMYGTIISLILVMCCKCWIVNANWFDGSQKNCVFWWALLGISSNVFKY